MKSVNPFTKPKADREVDNALAKENAKGKEVPAPIEEDVNPPSAMIWRFDKADKGDQVNNNYAYKEGAMKTGELGMLRSSHVFKYQPEDSIDDGKTPTIELHNFNFFRRSHKGFCADGQVHNPHAIVRGLMAGATYEWRQTCTIVKIVGLLSVFVLVFAFSFVCCCPDTLLTAQVIHVHGFERGSPLPWSQCHYHQWW